MLEIMALEIKMIAQARVMPKTKKRQITEDIGIAYIEDSESSFEDYSESSFDGEQDNQTQCQ